MAAIETAKLSMKSLFNGLPFLTDAFDNAYFMTAIASVRHQQAKKLKGDVEVPYSYIDPNAAVKLLMATNQGHELESIGENIDNKTDSPTHEQMESIHNAIASIIKLSPCWEPLLTVSNVFRVFDNEDVISFSNYARPQHVYLSRNLAFKNESELCEQIIHEMTHIWLYMMEELWRYHDIDTDNPTPYMLPTGAKNKTATEILSAAYVVTVLGDYYTMRKDTKWDERIEFLTDYRVNCVSQLIECTSLTALGEEVWKKLYHYR